MDSDLLESSSDSQRIGESTVGQLTLPFLECFGVCGKRVTSQADGSLTTSQWHLVWEVLTWLHTVARGVTDTFPSPSLAQRGPIVIPASLIWHKGP